MTMFVGCVDDEEEPDALAETSSSSLLITPQVQLDGLAVVESEVFLQDLFLGLGEIRLEPMDPERDGVVYVTRTPMMLHFDVASGQHVVEGEAITLPHSGEFSVAIEFSPMSVGDNALDGRAVRLDGLVAKETGDPENSDEPMPLPLLVGNDNSGVPGVMQKPVEWVPWTYSSLRTTTLTMNTVQFTEETGQLLVISLDMAQWLTGAVEPIHAAVDDQRDGVNVPDGNPTQEAAPIDVSGSLEEKGADVESLNARSETRLRGGPRK